VVWIKFFCARIGGIPKLQFFGELVNFFPVVNLGEKGLADLPWLPTNRRQFLKAMAVVDFEIDHAALVPDVNRGNANFATEYHCYAGPALRFSNHSATALSAPAFAIAVSVAA
jgi:hypothetical protein